MLKGVRKKKSWNTDENYTFDQGNEQIKKMKRGREDGEGEGEGEMEDHFTLCNIYLYSNNDNHNNSPKLTSDVDESRRQPNICVQTGEKRESESEQ